MKLEQKHYKNVLYSGNELFRVEKSAKLKGGEKITKIKGTELLERIWDVLEDMDEETFLEEVNRILGTEYTEKDIDWEE